MKTYKENIEKKELREKLSYWQHEIWSYWMKYLFSLCKKNEDGNYIIPKEKVDRWKRQIDTPYNKLSKSEKNSDREQVDRYLPIIEEFITKAIQQTINDLILEVFEMPTTFPEQESDDLDRGYLMCKNDIINKLKDKI